MTDSAEWPELSTVHTVAFDFDGIFTDNKVHVDQNGIESVRCDRGDGLGMDFMRCARRQGRLNAEMFILSKEPNPVVLARARKMQLDCLHGVADKKGYMGEYFASRRPGDDDPYAGLIFLGNDLNDLELIRVARFSVAPSDAHPLVKRSASAVLEQRGGEGFVRAFVERWLGIDKMSLEEIYECIHHR